MTRSDVMHWVCDLPHDSAKRCVVEWAEDALTKQRILVVHVRANGTTTMDECIRVVNAFTDEHGDRVVTATPSPPAR